jgi:hypothetical protein
MRETREYSGWDIGQARLNLLRMTHLLELDPQSPSRQRDYEAALERYEAMLGEVEVLGNGELQAQEL